MSSHLQNIAVGLNQGQDAEGASGHRTGPAADVALRRNGRRAGSRRIRIPADVVTERRHCVLNGRGIGEDFPVSLGPIWRYGC